MRRLLLKAAGGVVAVMLAIFIGATYHKTQWVQRGNPGLGMELIDTDEHLAAKEKANRLPYAFPPASTDGPRAVDAYKNVQVLGHLSTGEMTRLMTAITTWVAPEQGCAYCHAPQRDAAGEIVKNAQGYALADQERLWSDELYTKRVGRRMLQMTMHVNSDWKAHVQETGVTCYTCHRGNPVPANFWYKQPETYTNGGLTADSAGQNHPSRVAGLASLPADPFTSFLDGDEGIRVISTEALPIDNRSSIKQTEWTYALMMHFSNALGVNCTYCHNSRSMAEWSVSPAARTTAWHGIRMVRDLNQNFLGPLASTFPPERLGEMGDSPKVNCATCHNGAFKPLLGESMLKDYMVLAKAEPQPAKTIVAPATAAPVTSPPKGAVPSKAPPSAPKN